MVRTAAPPSRHDGDLPLPKLTITSCSAPCCLRTSASAVWKCHWRVRDGRRAMRVRRRRHASCAGAAQGTSAEAVGRRNRRGRRRRRSPGGGNGLSKIEAAGGRRRALRRRSGLRRGSSWSRGVCHLGWRGCSRCQDDGPAAATTSSAAAADTTSRLPGAAHLQLGTDPKARHDQGQSYRRTESGRKITRRPSSFQRRRACAGWLR